MKSVIIGFFLSIPMAFAMWGIVDLASATEDDISSTGISSDFCYVKIIKPEHTHSPSPTVTVTVTATAMPSPEPSITQTPEISPTPTVDFSPEP